MKNHIPTLLTTMIGTALYSQQGLATDLASQCILGIPSYNNSLVQNKSNELPVTIIADNFKGNYPNEAIFTGNVDINQGNSRLQADEVQFNKKQIINPEKPVRTVHALGNVRYYDNQVILRGSKIWLNLNTRDIDVWEGDYQIVGRQGHGKASLIKQREKNRYTILESGSFTSCLPGSDTWSVVGSEVVYDHEEQVIKIWNARFKLGSLPIFYSPYLQLSTGDKRCSGFLIPNAKYSITNHFECFLPYYWSIAPNIDATITPHYIHKRNNIIWENELRYLTQTGMGLMALYYLSSDKMFKEEHSTEGNHHRWLCHWQHSNVLNQMWRFNVNYTKVSDPYYFSDLSSKYGSSTDSYATHMFSIGYATQNFDATVSMRQFQIFNDQIIDTYGAEPQVDVNWYQNNIGPFDTQIYGQVVHIVNNNSNMPKTTRIHLEPSINLPWSNNWINLDAEVKLIATYYQQKNINNYNIANNMNLKKSVSYTLPQFRINGRFILERNMNLVRSYTQTLEPRMQYLYVPYRDQSKINNYDSSPLQYDYSSLFRDRVYGGFDRIASANQFSAGITSRVVDDNAVERFNVSVGQIYYFTESRTGDHDIIWKKNNKTSSLILVGNTYWRITDSWGIRGVMKYDAHLNTISNGSASVEYCRDEDHMVQLTYRHTNPEYIQTALTNSVTETKQYSHNISQVGGAANWPITEYWSIACAYYFDTNARKTADQKLNLQYNSCCYTIRVGLERKLNGWDISNNQRKYDNIIGFNVELRGLSSDYTNGTQQMLRSNILPYRSSL